MNEHKVKQTEKKKYVSPRMIGTAIEMENCIAAGSGAVLPAANSTPVNETWDNANVVTDTPTYW